MRILYLDDMQERHDYFDRKHRHDDVTHVYSHVEAVRALATFPAFDLASLDHDLGDGETGYYTAKYIAEVLTPEKRPLEVIVHSFNTVGAPLMVAVLQDAGVPVSWQQFKIED
jgi:CheY-like chemotaxis protein